MDISHGKGACLESGIPLETLSVDVRILSPPLKNTFGHGAKTAVTRASGPPPQMLRSYEGYRSYFTARDVLQACCM